jgi:hypothetical protein
VSSCSAKWRARLALGWRPYCCSSAAHAAAAAPAAAAPAAVAAPEGLRRVLAAPRQVKWGGPAGRAGTRGRRDSQLAGAGPGGSSPRLCNSQLAALKSGCCGVISRGEGS